MYLDVNGRIPNLRNQPYTGMTTAQPATYCMGEGQSNRDQGVTLSTESGLQAAYSYGNWGGGFENTTHWPSGAYYTYLMEGGAHHRDIVLMAAHFAIMSKAPGNPPPSGYTKRDPLLGDTQYYGNVMCSTLANRDEAWAFRELVFAATVAPATLADGMTFDEGAYFKDLVKGNSSYAAAMIKTVLSANEVNNGFWHFTYNNRDNTASMSSSSSGSSDPWMVSYIGEAWARGKLLHGGEAWGAQLTTMCNMQRNYFAGYLSGSTCTYLCGAQTINIKTGIGATPFKSSWAAVGKFPTPAYSAPYADVWMLANFIDTSEGWIALQHAHSPTTPGFPECPFDVGASLFFTQDYFSNTIDAATPNPIAPSPFTMEQVYYVVASDPTNSRIKVSSTRGGRVVIPTSTVSGVLWCVVDTSSCPATFVPSDFPTISLAYLTFNSPDGRMADMLRAIRTYRTAVDNPALQTAETNALTRVNSSYGAGTDFSDWPMGKVLV
jgi:hypothetical protein